MNKNVAKPSLAIIGFGDFAKLMIKHLSPYFNIVVASRHVIKDKQGLVFEQVDVPTALSQSIIIPSMPAQFLEEFFSANKKYLNSDTLIIDVCSVKVKPVEVLRRILPETVQILATHPMFGPASAKDGLKGQRIMIYPARLPKETYTKIKQFLSGMLGLKVIEASPDEHDHMMAYAQGLSHYIGRAMQLMEIPESEMTTKAYNDLLDMKRIQGGDSLELFESIMFENPYALEVNKKFKDTLTSLDDRLGIK